MIHEFDAEWPLHVYLAWLHDMVITTNYTMRGGEQKIMHTWYGCQKLKSADELRKRDPANIINGRRCRECLGIADYYDGGGNRPKAVREVLKARGAPDHVV